MSKKKTTEEFIEQAKPKNIVFDTAENIQEFEKIVKMDN